MGRKQISMSRSQTDTQQLPPIADGPGEIVRVDDSIRLAAVERLVAGGGGPSPGGRAGSRANRALAERFLAFSRENAIAIDAMWARVDPSGAIRATVLAVPNAGRTAILFSSTPTAEATVPELGRLIAHTTDALRGMEVDLAQVLLEPRATLQRDAFLAGGFHELAQLSYMERPLPGRPPTPAPDWPAGVTVETYHEGLRDDVLAVLDASYEDTLDCPGLRGLRRTEDILAGHLGTGVFDPGLWTLLRVDGRPSAVLLLNRSPASSAIELVYIGFAKAVRGRGLGRQLLRHGLRQVESSGERAITLAVDERNAPAISMYRGEGFRCVLRRVALICPISSSQCSDSSGDTGVSDAS
jgi:ribosomal protein S18 acetylase RimI-like enzyme